MPSRFRDGCDGHLPRPDHPAGAERERAEDPTRHVAGESIDFLGYTIGPFHGKGGRAYIGTRPSKTSVGKLRARIRAETSSHWNWQQPAERVEALDPILRGWCGYFNQGPVGKVYRTVRRYVERRLRGWLMRREQCRGAGYDRYPDRYLYRDLELFPVPDRPEAMPNAKAWWSGREPDALIGHVRFEERGGETGGG